MRDPWNATQDEILAWAYLVDPVWPAQDWDLAVAQERNAGLLLSLASAPPCPTRQFFLGCIYLMVGDAVRSGFNAHPRNAIEALLLLVSKHSPPDVVRWAERSRKLLDGGSGDVDYALWCNGGYVRAERDADGRS